MKRVLALTFVLALFMCGSAMSYTYYTTGLNSMDHYYAYTWGLNTAWSSSETIVSATLTFHDIYDWTYENDRLFVNLLDDALPGINSIYDGQSVLQNYFNGVGTYLGYWNDPYGDYAHRTDVSFDFTASQLSALATYAADGSFGFGIDPDCHYYARKTTFTVCTTTTGVPEPATLILIGLGLAGVGLIRRK